MPTGDDRDPAGQDLGKSRVRILVEEAQAIVARYVDPSDSLSTELIRERSAAAARGA